MHDSLRGALRQWIGRKSPRAAILDAQSVRTANHRGGRGYYAGKKVLGRNRNLVVDTLGLVLGVLVTPANASDTAGATRLSPEVISRFGWLRHFWADRTYGGLSILATLRKCFPKRELRVEIVRAKEGVKGFVVQPKRWIIERTFAWLIANRRQVRDYEQVEVNSEAMILIAMSKACAQTTGKTSLLNSLLCA